jgi:hypothetical protein
MNLIGDVLDSVRRFWNAVAFTSPGAEGRFPRQLETAIPAALPLNVRGAHLGWLCISMLCCC